MRVIKAIVTIVSMLIAVTLVVGLFVQSFSLILIELPLGTYRGISATLDRGSIQLTAFRIPGEWLPDRSEIGVHPSGFCLPNPKRSVWKFGADGSHGPTWRAFSIEFPFWVALLPCLIPPTCWHWRRCSTASQGFAVISSKPV
jgi:hypothetical protein